MHRQHRPGLLRWTIVAGACFTLLYAAGLAARPSELFLRVQSNVVYNVPALLALVLVAVAARRATSRREMWGWACMALMLAAWQAADWAYAYYDFVLRVEPPFPGLTDIPYTIGYAAFSVALALLLLPGHALRMGRWIIDAALLMTVAAVGTWVLIMSPVVEDGGTTAFGAAVALSYPVYDLGLIALVVLALASGRLQSVRAQLLLAAVAVQVLTDVMYTYALSHMSYDPYGNAMELGWIVAYLLIAAAAVAPDRHEEAARHAPASPFGVLLPYVIALPLVIEPIFDEFLQTPVIAVGAVLSVALIVARQALSSRDADRLYREVEREAQTRAAGEAKLAALFASIPDSVARLSRAGIYLDFKPGLDSLAAPEQIIGRGVRDGMPLEVADLATRLIEVCLRTRVTQSFEFQIPFSGSVRHYEGRMVPSGDDEVVAIVRDMTARQRVSSELRAAYEDLERSQARLQEQSALLEVTLAAEREQARRDSLTGALNHGAITGELHKLVSSGPQNSFATVMIDVNGMKATNDMFGHLVGDLLLTHVAGALSSDGAIVGRYGGDEFIAILPDGDRFAAEKYVEQARQRLVVAPIIDPETGTVVPVSVSMGAAVWPEEAATIADLIALADAAMYSAKRQRRLVPGEITPSRELAADRTAKMAGEVMPLLTSPGELADKLRLVGHRLSVGAGYDAVNVVLFLDDGGVSTHVFAPAPEDVLSLWRENQATTGRDHPMHRILDRTRRPVIIHDVLADAGLRDSERDLLQAAGLKSVLAAPLIWREEMAGVLYVASAHERAFGPDDAAFLTGVATQVTAIVKTSALVDSLRAATTRLAGSQAETVMMLAAAAEAHDKTTGLHLKSVRAIAEALASELGFDEEETSELGLAAALHDIGKFSVPDAVLSSSGSLHGDDWATMQQHTIWGGEFLAGREGFRLASIVARSHHERWDGGGYPDGLTGEAIPLAAAIVTVADSFDAMTHDRPYRAGRGVDDAVAEIQACAGAQFSPAVVDVLVRLHRRGMLPRPTGESHDHAEAA